MGRVLSSSKEDVLFVFRTCCFLYGERVFQPPKEDRFLKFGKVIVSFRFMTSNMLL